MGRKQKKNRRLRTPKEKSQTENVEKYPSKALGIPLILRAILKNLSVEDLNNCSLVCKTWNYESRCILRDFRICYAGTKKKQNACEGLKLLDSTLSQMRNIPFNGLRITIRGHNPGCCVGMKSINRYYDFLMNQFSVKYLEISVDASTGMQPNCPSVQLVQRILAKKSETLVQFSILSIPRYLKLNLTAEGGQISCPKLKLVKVSDSMDFRYLPRNLLPDLIAAAPNLEELRVEACPEDLRFLPLDKLQIVKTLLFVPMSRSDEELYRNFALAQPQLRDLRVRPPCLDYRDHEKFWDILKVIIDSSSNSLESLSLASLPAIMLKKFSTKPLRHVTSLVLHIDMSEGALPVRELLRGINFSKLFPSLKSISIYEDSVYDNEVAEYTHGELWEVEEDSTSAVSQMYISFDFFHGPHVQFLAEMFPNILHLQAVMSDSAFEPIYAVWEAWPSLETIKIEEVECHDIPNVDSVFCGIFPEEAALLQKQDDEFLRQVHIVPIRPSVASFSKLKKLHLTFPEDPFYSEEIVEDGTLFLSRVSGLIAFRRFEQLEVILELGETKLLKHLQPFARVVPRSA